MNFVVMDTEWLMCVRQELVLLTVPSTCAVLVSQNLEIFLLKKEVRSFLHYVKNVSVFMRWKGSV